MTLPVAVELTESVLRRRPVGMEIRGLDDYLRLAEVLAKSDLVPAAYRGKVPDIVVAMGMGAELGLSPFNALQSIYVVQGRPSLYVEAAIAIVRASGECSGLEVEGTEERATCRVSRRGHGTVEMVFTLDEAKRLGLTRNPNWTAQPAWMLQCRAIGRALHRLFPDLLRGVGLVDPSGRPVEQAEVAPRGVDTSTGEVTEPAPAPISGASLAALTARLAERPSPMPPPAPDPDPDPEPAPAAPPAAGPSDTEWAYKRSLVLEKRRKLNISDIVWARMLKHHAGVDDFGAVSFKGLDQLIEALGGLGKKPSLG